jgi:hypothetical protein
LLHHFGAAQDVVGGDAGVVEDDGDGVADADAQLVLFFGDGDAGCAGLDDEGFHAAAAGAGIHRRPDDDKAIGLIQGQTAVGAEDFLAVEYPFVGFFVENGRCPDIARV